jgi:arylsulfatase
MSPDHNRAKGLSISRRGLLRSTAAGAVSFSIGTIATKLTVKRPLNLIFIVSDALRADHVGMVKNGVTVMPTINALAERGIHFARCVAPSSWTLFSVPGLLSSTAPLPNSNVINRDTAFFPGRSQNFAELLAPETFTSAVIKNPWLYQAADLAPGKRRLFARGFETYHVPMPEVADNPLYPHFGGFEKYYPYEDAERATDQAINVIEMHRTRGDRRPFFLYLHYMDTHEPYYPPKKYRDLFVSGAPIPGVPDANLTGAIRHFAAQRNDTILADSERDIVERSRDMYTAAAGYVDAEIARLMGYLDERGILEKSLVVFTADHGEEFGEHGWIGHTRTLYREVLEVPLVIAGGDLPRGAVIHEPVASIDIAPSLLDLLGVKGPHPELEGEPALFGATGSKDIVSTTRHPSGEDVADYLSISITTRSGGKYICTWRADESGRLLEPSREVYDLRKDPEEKNNVSQSMGDFAEAKAEAVEALLAARRGQTGMTVEAPEGLEDAVRSLGYAN